MYHSHPLNQVNIQPLHDNPENAQPTTQHLGVVGVSSCAILLCYGLSLLSLLSLISSASNVSTPTGSSWQVDPHNIQGNRVGTAAQYRDQRKERQSLTPAPAPHGSPGKPPATGNILPGFHGPSDPLKTTKDLQSPNSARNIRP